MSRVSSVIAGDIGGTNARLALFENGAVAARWSSSSRRHKTFLQAFRAFLAEAVPGGISRDTPVCIAVAGVVEDDRRAAGTNLQWVVDCNEIISETGCGNCTVINDFEAAAWAVTVMPEQKCIQIGGAPPEKSGTKAVLGAGTGMGQAIVTFDRDGRAIVIRSEGGHCGFAPETPDETRLLSWLMSRYGHVSVERLLSGHGLVNIHSFLLGRPAASLPQGVENDRLAPEITRMALAGDDDSCVTALEMFCRIYGSEAGNLALKCLPSGGVYVAGGIAPRILPFLETSGFREAFENKGCMRQVLEQIPVFVIDEPDLGLVGAAVRAGMRPVMQP